ncbi:uncharacterized protein LOC118439398 [Folsomia candida]|uniref:uncharacterized protein LOC118439398 n=1 Tax=Folsomia candida TaxID=158441 RepID=UPI0016050102|nr:uncharacterized protein LOC118439398 [Folsomia candida]
MSSTNEMADKEETNLADLLAKLSEQQQTIENLQRTVAGGPADMNQAVKPSWSLGLSEDEEDDVEKMINGGGKEQHDEVDNEIAILLEDIEKGPDYGAEVLPQIAESFRKTVERPLTKESKEKLKLALKIPSNLKQFVPPKTNSEIWKILPSNARVVDIKSQQTQRALGEALSALSMIASTVVAHKTVIPKEATSSIVKLALDAGNILGDQIQSLNSSRRQEVKKHLNPEYAGICTSEGGETSQFEASGVGSSIVRQVMKNLDLPVEVLEIIKRSHQNQTELGDNMSRRYQNGLRFVNQRIGRCGKLILVII